MASANNKLKIISLFTGAGGLDLGFERAGFNIAVALESDPACCDTLRANRPYLPIIKERIENVSIEVLLKTANLKPLEAALIIGGPPCQSFSLAGLRKGINDDRGQLLFEYVRIVRGALPLGFVLENVKGLESWDSGKALKLLLSELTQPIEYQGQSYTYTVSRPQVLNAVDFNVPQYRERIVVVGNRKNMTYCYPKGNYKKTTVWSAIGNLPAPKEPSAMAKRISETIKERREKHGY